VYLKKFSGGVAPDPQGRGSGEEGEGREEGKGREGKGIRVGREGIGSPQCLTQIDAPVIISFSNDTYRALISVSVRI
jgi:hypothetical protein